MRRTEVLQRLRRMKFEDVHGRWQARRLSQADSGTRHSGALSRPRGGRAHSSVLGQGSDLGERDRVGGEAEDVADPVALAASHGVGPGVVAVAAHQDLDPRPAGAHALDDVAHAQGDQGAARRLPGRKMTATGLPVYWRRLGEPAQRRQVLAPQLHALPRLSSP